MTQELLAKKLSRPHWIGRRVIATHCDDTTRSKKIHQLHIEGVKKPSDQFSFIPPSDPLKIKWWWNFSHPFMYTDHLYDTQNSRAHLLFVPFFVLCCSRCSPFNIKYWITLCWPAGHLISLSVLYICETDDIINTTQKYHVHSYRQNTLNKRTKMKKKAPPSSVFGLMFFYFEFFYSLSLSVHCIVRPRKNEGNNTKCFCCFFFPSLYILYVYARAWQNRREAVWVSTHSTCDINIIK